MSTFSVWTPFLVVTGGTSLLGHSLQQDDRLTFLPAPNAFYANEHSDARHFMAPVNVVLQRDESIQLLAISVSKGSLIQDTFVAIFLHHEVAAVVSLGEDGGK